LFVLSSGPIQQPEAKRQSIQPIERTYRHREEGTLLKIELQRTALNNLLH
jgi:hypothetical protein